jgi:hypothetical protein
MTEKQAKEIIDLLKQILEHVENLDTEGIVIYKGSDY